MRALIFGGTGLLGFHLAKALRARGTPTCMASRHPPASRDDQLRWIRCDISNEELVRSAYAAFRPTTVIHLAAALQFACEEEPGIAVRANVAGTEAILQGARDFSCKAVVFASSLAVYGESKGELSEEAPPAQSISLYGGAKWFEECLGSAFARRYGFRFTALRYSGIFGPGEVTSPGMSRIRKRIESARLGARVTIDEARGDERAQLTYVTDAVDATLAVAESNSLSHTVYNVAGPRGNYVTLREYHATLKRLYNGTAEVEFTGRAKSAAALMTKRLESDTGFVPSVSVAEGLERMYGGPL